jgi:hypothetical protein
MPGPKPPNSIGPIMLPLPCPFKLSTWSTIWLAIVLEDVPSHCYISIIAMNIVGDNINHMIERGLHTVVFHELAPSSFLWGALTPRAFFFVASLWAKRYRLKSDSPDVIGESPEVCRFGESPPRCAGLVRAPRCAVLVRAPRCDSFGKSPAMWQFWYKPRARCAVLVRAPRAMCRALKSESPLWCIEEGTQSPKWTEGLAPRNS